MEQFYFCLMTKTPTVISSGIRDYGAWGPNHLRSPSLKIFVNRNHKFFFIKTVMPQGCVLHFSIKTAQK